MASIPGDEDSVAAAVRRHPTRIVGFFALNPAAADAMDRAERALTVGRLRCLCLFPAMHRYSYHDECVVRTFELASRHGAAIFAHCGYLSIEARTRLGLPSRDISRPVVEVPVLEAWVTKPLGDDWTVAYRIANQQGTPIVSEVRIYPREPLAKAGRWSGVFTGLEATAPLHLHF